MIELTVLNHDYDEEALGFPEPADHRAVPVMTIGERVGLAVTALGALVFVLTLLPFIGGADGVSFLQRGTWSALALSAGALVTGGTVFYWCRYRRQPAGIRNDDTVFRNVQRRGWIAWVLAVFLTGFYIVLYWYPALQARGVKPIFAWPIELLHPLAHALTGKPADQWFLYGFLYTVAVLVFGVRMLMRHRHNRYQLVRTGSVMFFQLGFAFLLPGFLKAMNDPSVPEHYFTYFWPLKPEYAYPGARSTIGWWFFGIGIASIVIVTPILTYFSGKRWYCSWVCGCGGLAETFGDPWRHLSDKSTTAWRIERVIIYSVLAFVIVVTALLWLNQARGGALLTYTWSGETHSLAGGLKSAYGFMIVNMFSGVIGVGFYPLMGSRVWCRFGCPMAAILGLLQVKASRFRITTNGDQCMSCGNCQTYCEMGIDVRAYAQRGEDIVRASCVGCGLCAAVCPRGVLRLENGPR